MVHNAHSAWITGGTTLMLLLGGCAAPLSPCGTSGASVKASYFDDPYNGWRQLSRAASDYERARGSGDVAATRVAAQRVCVKADGLRRFTREVSSEIRPQFTASVYRTMEAARNVAAQETDSKDIKSSLSTAVAQLSEDIPRFWLTVSASLRGQRQSGNPRYTHK